ncbi:hypothetical protein [Nocardia beijingensis]
MKNRTCVPGWIPGHSTVIHDSTPEHPAAIGSSLAPWTVQDPPGGAANVAIEDAASAEFASKHRPWPLPSGGCSVTGEEIVAAGVPGAAVAPGAGSGVVA